MTKVLEHLIAGGTVVRGDGTILTLSSYELLPIDQNKDAESFTPKQLESLEIYYNAEQLRIIELEAIVARQSSEINKLVLKNKKNRAEYKRMTDAEKIEAKTSVLLVKDKSRKEICSMLMSTYPISQSQAYKLVGEALSNTTT